MPYAGPPLPGWPWPAVRLQASLCRGKQAWPGSASGTGVLVTNPSRTDRRAMRVSRSPGLPGDVSGSSLLTFAFIFGRAGSSLLSRPGVGWGWGSAREVGSRSSLWSSAGSPCVPTPTPTPTAAPASAPWDRSLCWAGAEWGQDTVFSGGAALPGSLLCIWGVPERARLAPGGSPARRDGQA